MNDFEQRKAERIERYRTRAENAQARAQAAHRTADRIASFIPMGQPILVGHHSEKRHRRDLAKIDAGMRKGFEESKKADYWDGKAEAAESNRAISSNDPEAIEKLREKIGALESRHEKEKAANAAIRRAIKKDEKAGTYARNSARHIELIATLDIDADLKVGLMEWASAFPWPPRYDLPGNTSEIKRCKDRIAELEKRQRIAEQEAPAPRRIGGMTVTTNNERYSIELRFPGKPAPAILDRLKRDGWKWARSSRVWYRSQSNRTTWSVEGLTRLLDEEPTEETPGPIDSPQTHTPPEAGEETEDPEEEPEEQAEEEEEPEEQPEEGDLITEDFVTFFEVDLAGNRKAFTVGEDEDWREVFTAYQNRKQFWGTVWNLSDHGNLSIAQWTRPEE